MTVPLKVKVIVAGDEMTIDLSDLLHDVLVAQVATYLGVEPSVIDPTIDDD